MTIVYQLDSWHRQTNVTLGVSPQGSGSSADEATVWKGEQSRPLLVCKTNESAKVRLWLPTLQTWNLWLHSINIRLENLSNQWINSLRASINHHLKKECDNWGFISTTAGKQSLLYSTLYTPLSTLHHAQGDSSILVSFLTLTILSDPRTTTGTTTGLACESYLDQAAQIGDMGWYVQYQQESGPGWRKEGASEQMKRRTSLLTITGLFASWDPPWTIHYNYHRFPNTPILLHRILMRPEVDKVGCCSRNYNDHTHPTWVNSRINLLLLRFPRSLLLPNKALLRGKKWERRREGTRREGEKEQGDRQQNVLPSSPIQCCPQRSIPQPEQGTGTSSPSPI